MSPHSPGLAAHEHLMRLVETTNKTCVYVCRSVALLLCVWEATLCVYAESKKRMGVSVDCVLQSSTVIGP